jgi:histidinol-phosphate aminotransferase
MSKANYQIRAKDSMSRDLRPAGLSSSQDRQIELADTARRLTPYRAVTSQKDIAESDHDETFKLDWNESTIPPSPKVKEALTTYLMEGERGLNWYPKLGSETLLEHLEDYTNLTKDHLLATNGSDDALRLICSSYVDPGDEIVLPVPTYNQFIVFAQNRGAELTKIESSNPFERNLSELYDHVSSDTRLLYLVSPNNPAGTVIPPEDVEQLCRDFPETLIVLDEAYYEFSQTTGIELVEDYSNLIVTRTFSKAFGLAGLRVGYMAADPRVVEDMSRLYNPKSVNRMAQIGAVAALNDLDYLNSFLDEVEESKQMLEAFFTEKGFEAQVTPANFLVVNVGDVDETIDALEQKGIFVRDRSNYPGLDGCIRISVGTVSQTEKLIDRLESIF